ncbi:hypothetical protein V6615_16470 [Oscillospiraceae bacterium PP1C4]
MKRQKYIAKLLAPVDLNDCYCDYPSIIKVAGLNGWEQDKLAKPQDEPFKYELAGEFGDAEQAHRFAVKQDKKTIIQME